MKKIIFMSFSILMVSAALVFNSCDTSKKLVNEPVSGIIVAENVVNKTEIKEGIEIIEVEAFNHSGWNILLRKHVSDKGNVNYKGFKKEELKLKSYLTSLSNNYPVDTWSNDAKMAYWINAYNAFTIQLILDNYPISSIKDIENPWDIEFINLGDKTFSLNDIEHKILRKMNDPRIHFGIVCASVSCPKLENVAFEASNLDSQLDSAAKEFLADPARNNLSENSIQLSKIFKWFAKDFKNEGSLIDFLNKYSEITISQNAKKSYKDYDWNLNE
tara:strand:- start:2635 stop:3453 length:819 start_codon:yes stop_codon:yes gene_type:complete